jgi:amidase
VSNASHRQRVGIVGVAVSALLAISYVAATAPASAAALPSSSLVHGTGAVKAQDPTTFTITQTLNALEAHKYTSVELVEAYLNRIAKYEPYYNAFTQMYPDARSTRSHARSRVCRS